MVSVSVVSHSKGEVAGVLMPSSLVESSYQVLLPPWHILPAARTVVGPGSRERVLSPSVAGLVLGAVYLAY